MGEKDVDYKDAFWAATLGGARALGLDTVLGLSLIHISEPTRRRGIKVSLIVM